MARESQKAKAQRAVRIVRALAAHMPEAKIELEYSTPFELLVAVILSAQCTDKRVNLVTPALFKRFPNAAALAPARPEEVEPCIKTCGLFRAKARNLISMSQALLQRHGGQVPVSREALEALPGVGRKTAGVVCIHLGGDPAFPVDTHVRRLANRMGLSAHPNPDKVELDLAKVLPVALWTQGHQLLVWHGRRTCFARAPACGLCVVAEQCPKLGVKTKRTRTAAPALPSGASSASE